MSQYRTVELPEDLCRDADAWLTGRFDSLESFLGFLLREIVKNEGAKLDQREEEMLLQRLRDLGYL